MPFTLAHPAAILPFRRPPLVFSALVVGALAPDFEYFVRLRPGGGFGHTILGALVYTLPMALGVLWFFHAWMKRPASLLLPRSVELRLTPYLGDFHFDGAERFAWIVISILLGIATHLLWDQFTHRNTWGYHHWSVLREVFQVPVERYAPGYEILQHLSTLIGLSALALGFAAWYRRVPPSRNLSIERFTARQKIWIVAVAMFIAMAAGIVRGLIGVGIPPVHLKRFAGLVVVTTTALLWWQLVAFCIVVKQRMPALTRTARARTAPQ